MIFNFDTTSIASYRQFLQIKNLPVSHIRGRLAWVPDEYAHLVGIEAESTRLINWEPSSFLFDYQSAILKIALQKRKYSVFADCGLGKTLILLEFAQGAMMNLSHQGKGMLIVSPIMVMHQTIEESSIFYPGVEIERVPAADLQSWLDTCDGKIGITNYEAIRGELHKGQLGGLILDESSMLKSHYGKWGTRLLELGRGLEWKLACTGTPAPNDRIEYANHAVFMDQFPTVNSFLATFFVNRGQTDNRWELKPHALRPFYRALSHWCIFLTDPSVYGWHDNTETLPPINVTIHDVEMTDEQNVILRELTGELFASNMGGISSRSAFGQLGKGSYKGRSVATRKPEFIRELIDGWKDDESTIVWCLYNQEQQLIRDTLNSHAASIDGSTPVDKRIELVRAFKAGELKTLISKPKIMGFGLNLQKATRQVFSGLQDSYESYYQAVKRSNRYGSTKPLNVHIPVTDVEEPMVQNVLRKADRVQNDTDEQEKLFRSETTNDH